jgi:hypothetical protein
MIKPRKFTVDHLPYNAKLQVAARYPKDDSVQIDMKLEIEGQEHIPYTLFRPNLTLNYWELRGIIEALRVLEADIWSAQQI